MLSNKKQFVGFFTGFLLAVGLVYAITITGCQPNNVPTKVVSPTQTIQTVQGEVKTDAANLDKTTSTIKADATTGQSKTPLSIKEVLQPYWTDILVQVGVQENVVNDLKSKDAAFGQAIAQSDQLKKFADSETVRANKATADLNSAARARLYVFMGIGILLFAVGVALAFSGFTWGKAVGGIICVFSATLTVISLVVAQLLTYMPFIMIGLGLVGVGFIVWYFIQHKKATAAVVKAKVDITNKAMTLERQVSDSEAKRIAAENKNVSLAKDKETLLKQQQDLVNKANAVIKDRNELAVKHNALLKVQVAPDLLSRTTALESKTKVVEDKLTALDSKVVSVENNINQTKSYLDGCFRGMGMGKILNESVWTVKG